MSYNLNHKQSQLLDILTVACGHYVYCIEQQEQEPIVIVWDSFCQKILIEKDGDIDHHIKYNLWDRGFHKLIECHDADFWNPGICLLSWEQIEKEMKNNFLKPFEEPSTGNYCKGIPLEYLQPIISHWIVENWQECIEPKIPK